MNLLRIPLAYRTKRPLPAGWQKLSEQKLAELLASAPRPHNVGCRLDDLVVVDCDTPEAVAWWSEKSPVPTDYQSTARDPDERRAFWYMLPDRPIRAGKIFGGTIDIKTGSGHQVVLPRSIHPEGMRYEWVGDGGSLESAVLPPPRAPADFIDEHRSGSRGVGEPGVEDGRIPEGHRDDQLTSWLGFAREKGWPEPQLLDLARFLNGFCVPSMDESDLARIAHSVAQYPPGAISCTFDEIYEEEGA